MAHPPSQHTQAPRSAGMLSRLQSLRRQASTPAKMANTCVIRTLSLCGRSGLGYSPRMPRRRCAGTGLLHCGGGRAPPLGVKGNPPEKASATSAISPTMRDSAQDLCANTPSLPLSDDLVMVYIMRDSGCMGRFTSGRIERAGPTGVSVYDRNGAFVEYFSGTRTRSWCVFGPDGQRVEGWCEVTPEDSPRIFSRPSGI